VFLKIARLHASLGHFNEAAAAFVEAEHATTDAAERQAIELELADLCYRGARYGEALEILRKTSPDSDGASHYTRGRLMVQCLLRLWRLREAAGLMRELGEPESASHNELAGSVLAALMMPREADAAWERADSACRQGGDHVGAARVAIRRVRLAIEISGSIRDAERLIERVTPVDDVQFAQRCELRMMLQVMSGKKAALAATWHEAEKLLDSSSLEARTRVAALAAAFELLPDDQADRLLAGNLERMDPPTARLQYLTVLRYRRSATRPFTAVGEAVQAWGSGGADGLVNALSACDAWRLAGKAEIAQRALDGCVEDTGHLALREILNARQRVGLAPVADDVVRGFLGRTNGWGIGYAAWVEQVRRLAGEGLEERARALLGMHLEAGPVSFTKFHAEERRLSMRLLQDTAARAEYQRVMEQLGVPSGPDPVGGAASAALEFFRTTRALEPHVVSVAEQAARLVDALLPRLGSALASAPESVASICRTLLTSEPPEQGLVVLATAPGTDAAAYEAMFKPEQRCRRVSSTGSVVPRREEAQHRVVILESSFASTELQQRGSYSQRSSLTSVYGMAGLLPSVTPARDLPILLRTTEPSVIHFRTGFRQSTGGPVYLAFTDARGEFQLTGDLLLRVLGPLRQRPVLVILDPPITPDPLETARQVFRRNQFAGELFRAHVTGGVLGMGLLDLNEAAGFDEEFAKRLGAREEVAGIVEWMRRSIKSPIARLTVMLCTQDAELQLG
jgi:hypothetical protein